MRRSDLRKLYTVEEQTNPRTGRTERVLVYIGPRYAMDVEKLRQRRLPMLLALLAHIALFLWAGLIPASAQRCMYVLPFFIMGLLPLFYAMMALSKVWRFGTTIDEEQRTEGLLSMQHAAMGLLALDALWVITDAVYLVLNRTMFVIPYDLIFLGCAIGSAVCSGILWLCVRKFDAKPTGAQAQTHR